jgi:hypothetical protein
MYVVVNGQKVGDPVCNIVMSRFSYFILIFLISLSTAHSSGCDGLGESEAPKTVDGKGDDISASIMDAATEVGMQIEKQKGGRVTQEIQTDIGAKAIVFGVKLYWTDLGKKPFRAELIAKVKVQRRFVGDHWESVYFTNVEGADGKALSGSIKAFLKKREISAK